MTRSETLTLAAYAAVAGPVVGLLLAGPDLGLLGLVWAVAATVLGWFAGTAALGAADAATPRPDLAFRRRMWRWCGGAAAALAALCLAYVLGVTLGRASYPPGLIALHLLVTFAAAVLVRVMTGAAERAVASRRVAVERSRGAGPPGSAGPGPLP